MRRVARVILVVVLWLVVGAVINLVVVGGLAFVAPPTSLTGKFQREQDGRGWYGQVRRGWGVYELTVETDFQQRDWSASSSVPRASHHDPEWHVWWGEHSSPNHSVPAFDFGADSDAVTGRVTGRELTRDAYPPLWWQNDRTTSYVAAPTWSAPVHESSEMLNHRNIVAYERALGWPMLAVRGRRWKWLVPTDVGGAGGPYPADGPMLYEDLRNLGRKMSNRFGRDITIPLGPIWFGLAINALSYGLLAWGTVRAPSVLRRWRRQRGGRCVKCGYDLEGLAAGAACPECGAAAR